MKNLPYVVCAVHELSRHATKEEAEKEMNSYDASDKITYAIARLPDGDQAVRAPVKRSAKSSKKRGKVRR